MYVIGIAGGSCSGKTTLTGALEKRFGQSGKRLTVIHMDSYFKNPTPTVVAPITRRVYQDHNHPDSFKLAEFYADIDKALSSDVDVVIIEGLLILYLDEVREKLDLKIFVDLESDERIVRRIKRFMSFGQTMDEVTDRYLDTVRFRYNEFVEPSRWHADLVFNGTSKLDKSAAIVCTYVEAQLK